jgi:hypothetical protein
MDAAGKEMQGLTSRQVICKLDLSTALSVLVIVVHPSPSKRCAQIQLDRRLCRFDMLVLLLLLLLCCCNHHTAHTLS